MKYNTLVIIIFWMLIMLHNSTTYCMNKEIVDSLSSVNLKNNVEKILNEPIESSCFFWIKNFFMRYNDFRAYALVELASNANDADAEKILMLAGQYKSFGNVDISLWLPGGGLLVSTNFINIDNDRIGSVIFDNKFKELAQTLKNKNQEIFQEHLIVAIGLKKEAMAKLFVLLGADINTPIENGFHSISVATYARKQGMEHLAVLIEQRMKPLSQESRIATYLRAIAEKIL